MKVENIHQNTSGFLSDASYSFDLLGLLTEYKDNFLDAESLTLNLEEVSAGKKSDKKPIIFSDDGNKIIINLTESKYKDKRGKYTEAPTPESVYKHIRFMLERAVKEYSEKFLTAENE